MNNESTAPAVEEPIMKTSKLKKIARIAVSSAAYTVGIGVSVTSTYYSIKIIKMHYDTAKLQLEAAQAANN